ncbi:MAG: AMP-binding protein [Acidobacteriota bacterium]
MSVRTLSDLVFRIRDIASGRSDLLSSSTGGRREVLSTADFLRDIHSLALALKARDVRRGHRIAIFSGNRPEWHVADFACQLLGAHTVPVSSSLSAQQVGFILRNSACHWVFYDTRAKYELLASLESSLTSPPALVAFAAEAASEGGLTITRLIGDGAARQGDVPIERFRGVVGENDTASLIFLQGADGEPERASVRHLDLMTEVSRQNEKLELSLSDRAVAGLPLAHGLQRTVDHVCFLRGVAIHYPASKDEMAETLARERPNLLTASSEIYGQLFEQAKEAADRRRPLPRWLFYRAVSLSRRHAAARQTGAVGPLLALQRKVVSLLVFRQIHRRLGGCLRHAICQGPPVGSEVHRFFAEIGVPIEVAEDVPPVEISADVEPPL